MTKDRAFSTKFSSGQSHEFVHVGLARGQQRGHDLAAGAGHLIAMRLAHLADQSMCPQPRQGPCHLSAATALFQGVGQAGMEHRPHVPVAKTRHRPLAPAEEFQEPPIGLRPGVESPMTPPRFDDRATDSLGHVTAPPAPRTLASVSK